jgi:hypothetical protein
MTSQGNTPTEKDSFELDLKQGWYPIWVDYYNFDGPTELDILYSGPDTKNEWKRVEGYHFPEEKYTANKEH